MFESNVGNNEKDYIKLKEDIIEQCGADFNKENAVLVDYRMHILKFYSDNDPMKILQKEKGFLFAAEIQHDYWLHFQICDEVSKYIDFWKKDKLKIEHDIACVKRMEKIPNMNKNINDRILCFLDKKSIVFSEINEKWIEDFLACISKSDFWEKKEFLSYPQELKAPVHYDFFAPYYKYKMYTQYHDILSEIYNFCENESLKSKLEYFIKYSKYACVILVKEQYEAIAFGKRFSHSGRY